MLGPQGLTGHDPLNPDAVKGGPSVQDVQNAMKEWSVPPRHAKMDVENERILKAMRAEVKQNVSRAYVPRGPEPYTHACFQPS